MRAQQPIPREQVEQIYQLLYPYQIPHVERLCEILQNRECAVDGSDMGTGKMYSDCAVAAVMGLRPLICCPKSIIPTYFEVVNRFDLEILGITNYEALITGSYYTSADSFMADRRKVCPYYGGKSGRPGGQFPLAANTWNLPADALVIYDEAHKCRHNTATSAMMVSTVGAKVLLASATLADSVETFKNAATMLGLALGKHAFNAWIRRITTDGTNPIVAIHRAIYPALGSRMRISEIREIDDTVFARNNVESMICQMSPDEERGIMNAYGDIATAIEALKLRQIGEIHPLTVILRARQRIEMLKTPTFVMTAMEFLLSEKRVIIFVNFDATVDSLFSELAKFVQEEWPGSSVSVIRGGQKPSVRHDNVREFQTGRARVIICNIRAGGVGVSLHGADRAVLTSPPWSAIDTAQASGRAYRAGGGDVIQLFIYCQGSASEAGPGGKTNNTTFKNEKGDRVGVEELMAHNLNKKLRNIELLNCAQDTNAANI